MEVVLEARSEGQGSQVARNEWPTEQKNDKGWGLSLSSWVGRGPLAAQADLGRRILGNTRQCLLVNAASGSNHSKHDSFSGTGTRSRSCFRGGRRALQCH